MDAVLAEIGAAEVPRIRVVNKIDADRAVPRESSGTPVVPFRRVRLSALTGAGCDDLLSALAERFPAGAGHAPSTAEAADLHDE